MRKDLAEVFLCAVFFLLAEIEAEQPLMAIKEPQLAFDLAIAARKKDIGPSEPCQGGCIELRKGRPSIPLIHTEEEALPVMTLLAHKLCRAAFDGTAEREIHRFGPEAGLHRFAPGIISYGTTVRSFSPETGCADGTVHGIAARIGHAEIFIHIEYVVSYAYDLHQYSTLR